MIRIREEWKGTRGGTYYYVSEGDILKRISEYVISKRRVYESSRGITVGYEVSAERLYGKVIYEFSSFARLKCLKKPLAWTYQLWVMKLVCEALNVIGFEKKPYEDKPSWVIKQGSPEPAFTAKTTSGYYTF